MASAASLPANLHRHVVTDTLGLLVVVPVTAASVQDRDGGRGVLARAKMAMPSITLVWADGGYAGKLIAWIRQWCWDLTRYRKAQIDQRGREAQRLDKVLQDAGIKLSSVATDILGKSGRDVLVALISGTQDRSSR